MLHEPNILIQAQFILTPNIVILAPPPPPRVNQPQHRVKLAYQIPSKDITIFNNIYECEEYTIILAEWQKMFVVLKQFNEKQTKADRSTFIRELTAWRYFYYYFNIFILFYYCLLYCIVFLFLLNINFRESAHPWCVSMIGIIDEEDFFGFVSEYCPNGSLYLFSFFSFFLSFFFLKLFWLYKGKKGSVQEWLLVVFKQLKLHKIFLQP